MATNNVGVFDTVTINKQLIINGTGSTTFGPITAGASTLGATSATTLATSGAATFNSAAVTTNATVGGTLGVTGASNFGPITAGASTLGAVTATSVANSGSSSVVGTSALTGRVTGSGGFTSSSNVVSGINAATYTTVFTMPALGARGVVSIIGNLNSSPCMLAFYFEVTPGTTTASYTQIALSGNGAPAAPGLGTFGNINLLAQTASNNGSFQNLLQIKSVAGTGSVTVDVIYF